MFLDYDKHYSPAEVTNSPITPMGSYREGSQPIDQAFEPIYVDLNKLHPN